MRVDRKSTLAGLLVFALLLGGCSAPEGAGPVSGTSVSIGATATSSRAAPTMTPRQATLTRLASTITPRPTTVKPTATTPAITPSGPYTQAEIDYFLEVALGAEFGESEQVIKKWTKDVRIDVLGAPTEEDLQTLDRVVEEINNLIDGVEMVVVDRNPNVEMHFAPEDEFKSIEPNYVPVNYGFFWSYWNRGNEFTKSRLLISTDEVTQAERSHLIREEVTQLLGLMIDSNRYEESIFFEGWTETSNYAEIDKSVIEMLYRDDIEPGMTTSEVVEILEELR